MVFGLLLSLFLKYIYRTAQYFVYQLLILYLLFPCFMDVVSIILSVCMLNSHCNLAFSLYAIDSTMCLDHLPLHAKWYYPHKRQWTFLLSLSQLFWYWFFAKLGHTLIICVPFSVFFLHITMAKHSGCQCYVWWICFQMLFLRFINQGLYFHFWFSSSEPNQNYRHLSQKLFMQTLYFPFL